jgi:hypothetical protein
MLGVALLGAEEWFASSRPPSEARMLRQPRREALSA